MSFVRHIVADISHAEIILFTVNGYLLQFIGNIRCVLAGFIYLKPNIIITGTAVGIITLAKLYVGSKFLKIDFVFAIVFVQRAYHQAFIC